MLKRENYFVIQGFMVTDLHLKGNELLIYAIIYDFVRQQNKAFDESLSYLTKWTNSTKQAVLNNLKNLVKNGLIIKKEYFVSGVKKCEYHPSNFRRDK